MRRIVGGFDGGVPEGLLTPTARVVQLPLYDRWSG